MSEASTEAMLQEAIEPGTWWAVDVTDFALPRFKVQVYLAGADHFVIDKHFDFHGFVESDGTFSSGDAQLVRQLIKPTVRPYTKAEGIERLSGKMLLRKRDNVRCFVQAIRDFGAKLLNQDAGVDGPESWSSLAKNFTHLDGAPCGVVEGGDPWETAAE